MTGSSVALRKLVEHVLKEGADLPLAMLLTHLVPVGKLRELARKFDLSPKGFRVDKAPARVLGPQLAELRDADKLDEVIALLRLPPARGRKKEKDAETAAARIADLEALLKLRDEELGRLRDEVERARLNVERARGRESECSRRSEQLEDEVLRLRKEREQAIKTPAAPTAARSDEVRKLEREKHQLEIECERLLEADAAYRRQIAEERSRVRELESEVAELESLIPKSRRRKKKPLPPLPAEERRVRLPYFLPSFYKSLDGKDRKAVERAVQALLLFCTEGHSYPGLEVKQLGGQDMWSMRASLGLRVYFRPRDDGDIDVVELADREDQHTTLRRLKER